ncbi:hypothetical protein S7711_10724 [Stachybotrys chartarum IBT 7711]|uniref:Uncharacterized protein n=1 Tax=Stachybotrys chartarum (strain CBS 109288 / IBT 7711) TaxID=1280523 RepID=A0A084AFV4_STACB|nr:hypothetical protein S7711_10724 [Stachybotrys chartarum IBT 7711]KFA55316.1 hypothetical protein S40293_10872 [Stachybotrys chartarum IBT 40293]KFA77455.1 hypothetical protein S40288_10764 [Stachybotrys chartarum IBT 40288]
MQFKLSTLALAAMSVTSVYAAKVAQLETTLDSLTDQAHTISRYAQAVNAENVQQIIPEMAGDIRGLGNNVLGVIIGLDQSGIANQELLRADRDRICAALTSFVDAADEVVSEYHDVAGYVARSQLPEPILFIFGIADRGLTALTFGLEMLRPICQNTVEVPDVVA